MRTCLEIRSMDERHVEEVKNDYNRYDQYNEEHQDALATGDAQGKGTGNWPNGHTIPHFSPIPEPIDYSRFDTHFMITRNANHTNPGNGTDNVVRRDMIFRSKYDITNEYCPGGTFTDYNIYEGQF